MGRAESNSFDLQEVAGGRAPDGSPRHERNEPLFRPEALRAQDDLRLGNPMVALPVAWSVITVFLILIVASAALFIGTASFSRKETVRGVLRPVGGEHRIFASYGGTVKALYVGEGVHVEPGQLLALISTDRLIEGGGAANAAVLQALREEEDTLTRRLAALTDQRAQNDRAASAEIAALVAERRAATAAIASGETRLAIAQERVNAADPLAKKGLLPTEELRRRQEAKLAIEQAIVDAHAREAVLGARIARARSDKARLPSEETLSKGELEARLATVSQRRADAEAGRGYELRARSAGRVTALQASVGQSLDPARPLMTVTPEGSRLVAELYVPSRAIGFVETGQAVRLLYDAFPYQRFGPGSGHIEATSATVLLPAEVQAALPVEEPVYRVVVALDRAEVRAFGKSFALQPGMALTADIVLEKRSFGEWLFEPLMAMKGRM